MSQLSKLRKSAYQSQNCRCYYCGLPMWCDQQLGAFVADYAISARLARLLRCTAEHLQAQQDGGRNKQSNIAAACLFCNSHRHKGRGNAAPAPEVYKAHITKRMAKGKWHPANGRLRL